MLAVQEYLDIVLAFVRQHESWATPIVFTLAFAESLAFVSLVLPFWGILIAIGTLFGAGTTMNFVAIWCAASLGAALGDWASYWIGYHYHARIAQVWPLSKHPELLISGHRFFERWGVWAIVIGRFWGPLRASIPIVAGAVQMPLLQFQIANVASAFVWSFALLSPGAFGLSWFLAAPEAAP
jgi:membrane protein DedA with SNARE-associated domain